MYTLSIYSDSHRCTNRPMRMIAYQLDVVLGEVVNLLTVRRKNNTGWVLGISIELRSHRIDVVLIDMYITKDYRQMADLVPSDMSKHH